MERTRAGIAKTLGINITTVSEKLNTENRIKLCEAMAIKKAYFSELSLEYLFATDVA